MERTQNVNVVALENEFWQVGILPETGASTAYGRVRVGEDWIDLMRPTAPEDYGNSSKAANFIMLPWCNRIRDGVLRFNGQTYQMRTEKDDGTARHGDVRKRVWQVESQSYRHVYLTITSADYADMNYPFKFSARAEYALEGRDFVWRLTLKNEDTRPMPGGFGFHPYFVRPEAEPKVMVPCEQQFNLVNYLAEGGPVLLTNRLNFQQPRALGNDEINDVLTGRVVDAPAFMQFPSANVGLLMRADPIYRHLLLYAPVGQPFFALEPMTNVNDGFNLLARGIDESGVFTLQPGESQAGEVRLEMVATSA